MAHFCNFFILHLRLYSFVCYFFESANFNKYLHGYLNMVLSKVLHFSNQWFFCVLRYKSLKSCCVRSGCKCMYRMLEYRTKRYLKYQNIHILLNFSIAAIFSEPGFTIWQAIPFKRKFYSYIVMMQLRWDMANYFFSLFLLFKKQQSFRQNVCGLRVLFS